MLIFITIKKEQNRKYFLQQKQQKDNCILHIMFSSKLKTVKGIVKFQRFKNRKFNNKEFEMKYIVNGFEMFTLFHK